MYLTTLPNDFPSSINYPVDGIADELAALDTTHVTTCIRLHQHKGHHLTDRYTDTVPWCPTGRYLSVRPKFPLEPDWHSGAYYVQDASSMVLYEALASIVVPAEPIVLDLCAAPGGKSSLIAEWLDGKGTLTANEVISSRASVLARNLSKSGYANIMVTQQKAEQIAKSPITYDLVLVDAPCSGEGLWRKNPKAVDEWSVTAVQHCATRQADILTAIGPTVRPGGYLIYMTCTYNDLENDQQVNRLLKTGEWELANPDLQSYQGTLQTSYGHLLIPGRVKGEGQYMAVLQKKRDSGSTAQVLKTKKPNYLSRRQREVAMPLIQDSTLEYPAIITSKGQLYLIPSTLLDQYEALRQTGRVVRAGLIAGRLSDRLLIPSPEVAMQIYRSASVQTYACSHEEALAYVHKELSSIDSNKGWILMCYQGNGLGWAKNLGKRINNYYK